MALAIRGHNSKLLVCDIVLADTQPDTQKVIYDINMAGKERSVKQWHALMEGTEFQIEGIIGILLFAVSLKLCYVNSLCSYGFLNTYEQF